MVVAYAIALAIASSTGVRSVDLGFKLPFKKTVGFDIHRICPDGFGVTECIIKG